jgi:hypothetical protein
VPVALLGDQDAPCRATRARHCPVPGHPCLTDVTAAEVVDAVDALTGNGEHARPIPLGADRPRQEVTR